MTHAADESVTRLPRAVPDTPHPATERPGPRVWASDDEEPIELIAPDSLTAEMVGHWTYLMLEGAAFAMQGLHPVIRDVTDKYSVSRTDPGGRAIRSVDSVLRWTYGGLEAVQEGTRLRSLHEPLTMRNEAGKRISALNPGAYQWVIATAYVTTAKAGPLLIGREFTSEELDDLLADNIRIAKILRVPMKGYPQTRAEFDAYYEHIVTEVLSANDTVRADYAMLRKSDTEQLRALPYPARPIVRALARPFLRFNYLSIVGLLDPRLRTMIGVDWTPQEQRRLEQIYAVIRFAYKVLPERLTYFPIAYHARGHHRAIQKMKVRELKSAAYKVRPKQV
ncbi:oxygenase MpaB family protein [Nocardia takedensis]|uniref:oxygenase MpaB family protein n=1 Tax=Nocardia takedensis TaxID=259390 RepID=UPI00031416D6|nr:oxygenase MpaB family protein [Nocardia takedensis]